MEAPGSLSRSFSLVTSPGVPTGYPLDFPKARGNHRRYSCEAVVERPSVEDDDIKVTFSLHGEGSDPETAAYRLDGAMHTGR